MQRKVFIALRMLFLGKLGVSHPRVCMVIKLGDRKVVDDLSRPRDLAAAAYRTIGPKLFFFFWPECRRAMW